MPDVKAVGAHPPQASCISLPNLVNILHRHMSSILTANQRPFLHFNNEMTEIQRFLGNFSIEFTIRKWQS